MFDPAAVSSRMSPGDKVSMTVHKAKAEAPGSFVSNAQSAGMIPGGGAGAAPHMPQMSAVSQPAVPGANVRALLINRLRQRMLTGR